jgi:hypothetical protein
MHITHSGAASYYCAELAELTTLLETHGYTQESTTSMYEASRWRKARSLLVIYYNGTVLLQGADTATPRALFDSFNAQQSLPF